LLGEAVAVGLAFVPDARRHLGAYFLLLAAASVVALLAAQSLSGSGAAFLLLSGGLLRATLLLRSPDLSDDVRRYLWDARVAAAGISPYAHAPEDPSVSRIAPAAAAAVPHSGVRSVYPPVAQAAFRAARLFGGEALPVKAIFAAADLSVVALILALGGPGARFGAALYAFHPLAVTESAGQGHLDSLGIALLLAALVLLARGRRGRAGIAFALAVLTKYVPLAAAGPMARRGRLAFSASALAVGAAIWISATRGGVSPIGGLPDYASRWEFNSVLYPALAGAFERGDVAGHAKAAFIGIKGFLGHPAWTQALFPFFYAGFFARAALAAALLAALCAIAWRVRDTERAVFLSLAALLLASPTLQPWYLLWIVPFAARRKEPAFLYLSFAVPLSYALLYRSPWLPPPAVYALEYLPFFALLLLPWLRRRRAA
jgi:Glycosyltransferase family 87